MQVNGKRKRLYFRTAAAAKDELARLKIEARRQGEAGLNMPDALRGEAVDAARRLKPYNKGIRDAVDFYLSLLCHHGRRARCPPSFAVLLLSALWDEADGEVLPRALGG